MATLTSSSVEGNLPRLAQQKPSRVFFFARGFCTTEICIVISEETFPVTITGNRQGRFQEIVLDIPKSYVDSSWYFTTIVHSDSLRKKSNNLSSDSALCYRKCSVGWFPSNFSKNPWLSLALKSSPKDARNSLRDLRSSSGSFDGFPIPFHWKKQIIIMIQIPCRSFFFSKSLD